MKKLTALFLALVMALTTATFPAFAETSGDYTYSVNSDGTATITDYIGTDTKLTIPSEIESYPVTSIGDYAFYSTAIEEIVIPDSVISIGDYAFSHCESLKIVTLGNSVETIGEYTFHRTAIEEIVIPDKVTSIGYGAFANCTSLKKAVIGKNVEEIGEDAFGGCTIALVIYGKTGSYAETYAIENNISFIDEENNVNIPTTRVPEGEALWGYGAADEEVTYIAGGTIDDAIKAANRNADPALVTYIKLTNDVLCTSGGRIEKDVVLDLNSKTLSYPENRHLSGGDGNLTIKNGSIIGEVYFSSYNTFKKLEIENCNITNNSYRTLDVWDGVVTLKNNTITAPNGVAIDQNGGTLYLGNNIIKSGGKCYAKIYDAVIYAHDGAEAPTYYTGEPIEIYNQYAKANTVFINGVKPENKDKFILTGEQKEIYCLEYNDTDETLSYSDLNALNILVEWDFVKMGEIPESFTNSGNILEAIEAANSNTNSNTPVTYIKLKNGGSFCTDFEIFENKNVILDIGAYELYANFATISNSGVFDICGDIENSVIRDVYISNNNHMTISNTKIYINGSIDNYGTTIIDGAEINPDFKGDFRQARGGGEFTTINNLCTYNDTGELIKTPTLIMLGGVIVSGGEYAVYNEGDFYISGGEIVTDICNSGKIYAYYGEENPVYYNGNVIEIYEVDSYNGKVVVNEVAPQAKEKFVFHSEQAADYNFVYNEVEKTLVAEEIICAEWAVVNVGETPTEFTDSGCFSRLEEIVRNNIDETKATYIRLIKDASVDNLYLSGEDNVVLDLNGYTLYSTYTYASNDYLTIKNGTLIGDYCGIRFSGTELTLENCIISLLDEGDEVELSRYSSINAENFNPDKPISISIFSIIFRRVVVSGVSAENKDKFISNSSEFTLEYSEADSALILVEREPMSLTWYDEDGITVLEDEYEYETSTGKGAPMEYIPRAEKEGYSFAGWSYRILGEIQWSQDLFTDTDPIVTDMEFKAVFNKVETSQQKIELKVNSSGKWDYKALTNEALQVEGKIIKGFVDENGNMFSSYDDNVTDKTLYPVYIDTNDMMNATVVKGGENDDNPIPSDAVYKNGLYIQGVQIRTELEENSPTMGLRFVSVVNDDLMTLLDNADRIYSIRFGTIVIKSCNLKNGEALTADTKYAIDAVGDNIYRNATTLNSNYEKFTACIVNIPKKDYKTDITIRPYIYYTDESGIERYIYGEEYSTNLFDAAQEAINKKSEKDNVLDYIMDNIISQAA